MHDNEVTNYSRIIFVIFATIRRARVLRGGFRCELNDAIHCGVA
jgi:hypothetical protein